ALCLRLSAETVQGAGYRHCFLLRLLLATATEPSPDGSGSPEEHCLFEQVLCSDRWKLRQDRCEKGDATRATADSRNSCIKKAATIAAASLFLDSISLIVEEMVLQIFVSVSRYYFNPFFVFEEPLRTECWESTLEVSCDERMRVEHDVFVLLGDPLEIG